jgi:hypothetical protein
MLIVLVTSSFFALRDIIKDYPVVAWDCADILRESVDNIGDFI